jgi:uncharacterized membrane protein
MSTKSTRIQTFDIIRGVAIFVMVFWHVLLHWMEPESEWLLVFIRLLTNMMAVSAFVFVSGLGFGFSWQKDVNQSLAKKQIRIKSISHSIAILIISLGYNLMGVFIHGYGWENLWYWYILQTIAISRLINLILMDFKEYLRLLIALIIIFLAPFYLNLLLAQKDSNSVVNVIYFISYNPIKADSPFIFLPFFIIGSIYGQKIAKIIQKESATDETERFYSVRKELNNIMVQGLFLFLGGILIGLQQTTIEIGWNYIENLNTHPNINITSLPLFLIRSSFAWCLYCIGFEIIVFAILLKYLDFTKKPHQEKVRPSYNILQLFGKYSLTIYLTHYLFFLIPFQLTYKSIWIAVVGLLGLIWFLTALLEKYGKGKVSIEYIIRYISTLILKSWMNKLEKEEGNNGS